MDAKGNGWAPAGLEAWRLVQQMLADLTKTVIEDSASERELLEGLTVVAKATALCTEISVEADPENPRFFDMCTDNRLIAGSNPDGRYLLAMIRGDRTYRVTGHRGDTAYLGFQVLAGTGLTPRRMAAYLGDRELRCYGGTFSFILSAVEPTPEVLGNSQWVQIPEDASSIVVREYIADADSELAAMMTIECLDSAPLQPLSDDAVAQAFTAMAWTIVKLTTLHRTIKPELLDQPNVLVTAQSAEIGGDVSTPDNLYMIGSFELDPDESLVLEFTPPDTRYWNVTLENVWHECLEPRRRHSSVTNKGVRPNQFGRVRIAIGANDFGHGHWLDTGGRQRGFVVIRWLDNPEPPALHSEVVRGSAD
ncbi:hypothetical protein MPNTM1_04760 [Mycolicibacterium parafortuitum]|uniref:hypothetical protein n=1 Tax=Mycolicibacterium parafortuitum TaxID=39692 RepID=UPI0032C4A63A